MIEVLEKYLLPKDANKDIFSDPKLYTLQVAKLYIQLGKFHEALQMAGV